MLRMYWEIEVRDKDGKLLSKRKGKSKSYLRQYLALLKGVFTMRYGSTMFVGNTTVLDEGGVSRAFPYNAMTLLAKQGMPVNAEAADSSFGLSVGTSDAVNTKDTVALGAKIVHGTASGQLSYGVSTFEDTISPPATMDWLFRIIRVFTNASPASITVREIGLVVGTEDSGGLRRNFLIARDVIPATVVPVGSTLTVRYIPRITVA